MLKRFFWRFLFCIEFDLNQETTGKKYKSDMELWRFSDDVYKDTGRWLHPVESARNEFRKIGR